MDNLLQKIDNRLQHYNRDELIRLIKDFLDYQDEDTLADFLDLMRQKSRPVVIETLELEAEENALLQRIQELYDALANDEYVHQGSGYDPGYGEYRGFGDDSWIDEMDSLFAAATSLYQTGDYQAAADAYMALFNIFNLVEDGYHFTRPDPSAALQTDLTLMQQHLFTSLGMLNPNPAALIVADSEYASTDRTLIGLSSSLCFFSGNRYALLDAWASHPDWMHSLTAHLIEVCRQPVRQQEPFYGLGHEAELLREWYRRSASLAEREALCQEVGPQQGWTYVDLLRAYQQQEQWAQMLTWAEEGLSRLSPQSIYRLELEETRGLALLRLDRPAEALGILQSLLTRKPDVSVYLTLRAAAQATDTWAQVYLQVISTGEQQVLAEVAHRTSSNLMYAVVLGFAHLLEGQIERAIAWAMRPEIPMGWSDNDLLSAITGGLLRMGLAAAGAQPDAILREALNDAPVIIRQQGDLLDITARTLPPDTLLDGAVRLYDRLLDRAVDGRKRESYAVAGGYAKIIRAIRQLQGRSNDFDSYYQNLFEIYTRLPACKDELRIAIEGAGYKQKQKQKRR